MDKSNKEFTNYTVCLYVDSFPTAVEASERALLVSSEILKEWLECLREEINKAVSGGYSECKFEVTAQQRESAFFFPLFQDILEELGYTVVIGSPNQNIHPIMVSWDDALRE